MVKVLVGATGSVASVKIPLIVSELSKCKNAIVKVVSTKHALHFFDKEQLKKDTGVTVLTDEDEWNSWTVMSDPVLHIELRNWADVFIICPLDANTLAKMANGLCDNLITCILRAWPQSKQVIVSPAMNTNMWEHPFTEKHLKVLVDELHMEVIPPVSKKLACGDIGVGAMAEVPTIVNYVKMKFGLTE